MRRFMVVAMASIGLAGLSDPAQAQPLGAARRPILAPRAPVGTAFTYQGRVVRAGAPLNETCGLSLSLWDSLTAGTFINSNTFSSVPIAEGLFTVQIDYGNTAFAGEERYLETAVKCAADASYVTLTPRTRLTATPYAHYALRNWGLAGNAATGGTGFLGTTDNTALSIGVNGAPALRFFPDPMSPNLLGGYSGNSIAAGVYGATIGGGGSFFYENQVGANFGTVGGGRHNRANGLYAAVGGGNDNLAGQDNAVVAGGLNNQATGGSATIGGGFYNVASGYVAVVAGGDLNEATGQNASIGGGYDNTAGGANATVGGGVFNQALDHATTVAGGHGNQATVQLSTIAGGLFNQATARSATVGGGEYNLASGDGSTVSGGGWNGSAQAANQAAAPASTVGGGFGNVISADGAQGTIGGGQGNQITAPGGTNLGFATIGGGVNNRVNLGGATVGGGNANTASGFDATVAGGNSNTASGAAATVPGGNSNTAAGASSFAAGYRAKAQNNGCFVWNDNTDTDLACTTNNAFVARATGGVFFFTNAANSTGVYVAAGGGGWLAVSDRNMKENVVPVEPREVLEKVAALPIASWSYRTQDSSIRHMGPMAQDFREAFGLGESERHIGSVDADGVALAAIQGLRQLLREREAVIEDLQARLERLERLVMAPAR